MSQDNSSNQPTLAQILAEERTSEGYQKRLQSLDYEPSFLQNDVIDLSRQIVDIYLDGNILDYNNNFSVKHECFKLMRITFIEKALTTIKDNERKEFMRKVVDIESSHDELDIEIITNQYNSRFQNQSLLKDLVEIENKLYLDYHKSGRDKFIETYRNLTPEHDKKKIFLEATLDMINNGIGAYFAHFGFLKDEYSNI